MTKDETSRGAGMDNFLAVLKEKLKEPRYLAVAAAIGGLVLGLIIGWGIWPVTWSDASAENLRPDLRVDYLRSVITTYSLNNDAVKAAQMYNELGSKASSTLKELTANPGFLGVEQIARFTQAMTGKSVASADEPGPINTATQIPGIATVAPKPGPENEKGGLLKLGFILLGILVVGGALAYFFYFKNRGGEGGKPLEDMGPVNRNPAIVPMRQTKQSQYMYTGSPAQPHAVPTRSNYPANEPSSDNVATIPPSATNWFSKPKQNGTPNDAKPLAQFMTTYMFGDDLYDESFTFDAPNGEFLGECGVSISDIIGVGEPKKMSAFEVWLFDKNDVQTVTKVLMSEHTFNDPNLRQRLEMKGEPVLAAPGKIILLETATLRLEGRMVDVSYGGGPMPENSYFQRLTMELSIARK
jgi:hypothetical protein